MPTDLPVEIALGAVLMAALVLYALMGGADFGGGVWDLFASGPRKAEQHALIADVISPIWKTNHVWLILAIVVLFSGFPRAFAAISIALHVPLTLFLVGVVFRGSAFTFRAYDAREDAVQRRWGLIFSFASIVSPILLGMIVGALASGRIRYEGGVVSSGFFASWLTPFSLVVGLFALALFALLAATYLTNEASSPELAEDFRRRALFAGVAVGVFALLAFALAGEGAPRVREGLTARPFTWPLHAATGVAALAAFGALFYRRYALARVAVAAQTTFILLGWAASQFPYLVVPDLTFAGAAGSPKTQRLVLYALAGSAVVIVPSLVVLFRVFRRSKEEGGEGRP